MMSSVNGDDGINDIEGKVARASDEGDGKRPSFKSVVKTAAWKFVSARAPRPGRRGDRSLEYGILRDKICTQKANRLEEKDAR